MLNTIEKTIDHLKHKAMLNYEELYDGFSKEDAITMRKLAVEKWPNEVA